jgi:hypothetical protein
MGRNRHDNSKGINIDEEKRVDNRLKQLLYELNPELRNKNREYASKSRTRNYKGKKR